MPYTNESTRALSARACEKRRAERRRSLCDARVLRVDEGVGADGEEQGGNDGDYLMYRVGERRDRVERSVLRDRDGVERNACRSSCGASRGSGWHARNSGSKRVARVRPTLRKNRRLCAETPSGRSRSNMRRLRAINLVFNLSRFREVLPPLRAHETLFKYESIERGLARIPLFSDPLAEDFSFLAQARYVIAGKVGSLRGLPRGYVPDTVEINIIAHLRIGARDLSIVY